MIQRDLFTDETAARDEALDRVLANAGEDWQAKAMRVFRRLDQQELTGEDIRLACEYQGVKPPHHNAWGAFVARLVRDGYLVPTGRERPMRAKGSHARRTRIYRIVNKGRN